MNNNNNGRGYNNGYGGNGYGGNGGYNDGYGRGGNAINGLSDSNAVLAQQKAAQTAEKNGGSDKKRAVLRKTLAVSAIVLLMVVSIVYATYHRIVSQMNIVDEYSKGEVVVTDTDLFVSGSDEIDVPDGVVVSDKDVHVILLVGSDSRLNGDNYSKSDTMMLMILDRVHKKIKLVSIMRDLYAPIKGHGSNKINYAFAYDSSLGNMNLDLTIGTIENCFGVKIDNFVVVDFKIFRIFIDRLGGMDIELTEDQAKYMKRENKWSSPENKKKKVAGVYHMNGAECLAYCRMRYVGEGDFDRTARQRDFAMKLFDKVKSMSYVEMAKLAMDCLPEITTNFTEGEILGFAFESPELLKYDIAQLSFPIKGSWKFGWTTIGVTNVSVLLTDYNFCSKALQAFIYEDDMTYVNGAEATGCVFPVVSTIAITEETEFADPSETTTPGEGGTTTTASAAPTAATTTTTVPPESTP